MIQNSDRETTVRMTCRPKMFIQANTVLVNISRMFPDTVAVVVDAFTQAICHTHVLNATQVAAETVDDISTVAVGRRTTVKDMGITSSETADGFLSR